MNTVKHTLAKVIIAIMFFLGMAVTGSGSANAQTTGTRETVAVICGVSNEEVIKYLNDYGYSVIALRNIDGSCDKIASTTAGSIRVYITDSRIIGHDEDNL